MDETGFVRRRVNDAEDAMRVLKILHFRLGLLLILLDDTKLK